MRTSLKRRLAALAGGALVASTVAVGVGATSAGAGSQVVTNACKANATQAYSDIDWTLSGDAVANPVDLGDPVTLTNGTLQGFVPADLLLAGFNLGLLGPGVNNIPTDIYVARAATNADTGSGVPGTVVQVDVVSIIATTTITVSPLSATPISISEALPDFTVTSTGGAVEFSQAEAGVLPEVSVPSAVSPTPPESLVQPAGSIFTKSSISPTLNVTFDCSPGLSADPNGDGDNETFTPAASWPAFESVTVLAPPTAPVCVNESVSVGANQPVPIDLTDNCTDVNGNIDPTSYVVSTPSDGTLTPTGNGTYTYDAPANDPGAPVTIDFSVSDTTPAIDGGPLTSNTATVSVTILADQCDATLSLCSLQQIVVQPVVGTTMTLEKVPGNVIMSTVVLDGTPQVSTGEIQQMTVTNARGTAAGWSLSAYATDIGAPGGPTLDLTPFGLAGVVIPACTVEGTPTGGAAGEPTAADYLCIPGNNLAWSPSATVAHDVIYGDVATVNPGDAIATDAADWLSQLTAAGNANAGGLGGLQTLNVLCDSPAEQSGGTFTCDADLFLGVPASAGAGTYTGGLVLTLL